MSKKVLIIASKANSLINFRYYLIKDFMRYDCNVIACAPVDADTAKVIDILQGINVKFVPVQLRNTGLNFFYDLVTIFNLYKIIREVKPDLVFSYTIKPVIYGSIAARLAKVTSVCSMITGLGYIFIGESFKIRMLRSIVEKLYALALKFNKKVFFQNQDDLQLFVNRKIVPKVRTVLINGSGVDIDYYQLLPLLNNCVFLFIARLLKDKGIYEYIQAAHIVRRRYPEVRFLLVGGCDANPNSVTELELSRWTEERVVDYLGVLEDVRSALAAASVFVLPSYREGTPRSVLEAMAAGRPIITTDAPGCRETVVHGVNGYLVPVKNVDKLVEAMERFILHPGLIASMGLASRGIAKEKYDVNKVNKMIFSALGFEV